MEEKWNDDAWETRCSEVYNQLVEGAMDYLRETLDSLPEELHGFFKRNAMRELRHNERMFMALKQSGCASEEIDYLFNDTDFYFTKLVGSYVPTTPRREKVAYKPAVHKAMRFKKNNVR
jgi:hypothetical protein